MAQNRKKTNLVDELNPYNPRKHKLTKKEVEDFEIRLALSQSNGKPVGRVDTYKTKLEPLFERPLLDYTKVVRAYNTAASVGKEDCMSFLDLFFVINCLGFATHSKASECIAFENRNLFKNEKFEEEAIRVFGPIAKGFTPANILSEMNRIVKTVKGSAGEGISTKLLRSVPGLEQIFKKNTDLRKPKEEIEDLRVKIEEYDEDIRLIDLELDSNTNTEEIKSLESRKKDLMRLRKKTSTKLDKKEDAFASLEKTAGAMKLFQEFFDDVYYELSTFQVEGEDGGMGPLIKSVKDIKPNLKYVLGCFDRVLQKYSTDFDPIEGNYDILEKHNPPSRVISFDPEQPDLTLETLLKNKPLLAIWTHAIRKQRLVRLNVIERYDFSEGVGVVLTDDLFGNTNEPFNRPLGVGVKYYKETPEEDILKDLKMDQGNLAKVQDLKKAYSLLDDIFTFADDSGSKYRTAIGAKGRSFNRNYWSRLVTLHSIVSAFYVWDLPQEVYNTPSLFKNTYLGLASLKDAIQYLNQSVPALKDSLNRLAGYSEDLPTMDDVTVFETVGKAASLVASDLKTIRTSNASLDEESRIDIPSNPDWIKSIGKIVKIGGGMDDVQEELKAKVEGYNYLLDQVESQINHLGTRFSNITSQAWVSKRIDVLRESMKDHLSFNENNYEELGYRRVLDDFLKYVRDMGDRELSQRVINTLLNRGIVPGARRRSLLIDHVLQNKGRYYVDPRSRYKHEALPVNMKNLRDFDIIKFIKECINWINCHKDLPQGKKLCLVLRFRIYLLKIASHFLPEEIPTSSIFREPLPLIEGKQFVSPTLDIHQSLPQSKVRSIINLYLNKIEVLGKEITQSKGNQIFNFRRVGTASLGFVFKTDEDGVIHWKLPRGFLEGKRPVNKLVRAIKDGKIEGLSEKTRISEESSELLLDEEDIGILIADKLKVDGKSKINPFLPAIRTLLRELPHQLCIDLGLDIEKGKDRYAVFFGKSKKGSSVQGKAPEMKKELRFRKSNSLAILTSSANRLGRMEDVITKNGVSLGDVEIQVEQRFLNHLNYLNNCRVEVKECELEDRLRFNVNVPVSRIIHPEEFKGKPFKPTQKIGVDLGVDGIGYGIREIQSGKATAHGHLRLRGTKKLQKRSTEYRGKAQPKRDYEKTSESQLSKQRAWGVGEAKGHLLSMMAHYNAVLTFEDNVSGFTGGSKVMTNLFKDIVESFCYSSDNDAANLRRKHSFFGMDNIKVEVPLGDKVEIVRFSPGKKVYGAYTSQECSTCGQNVFKEVRDSKTKTYAVDQNGYITLDSGKRYALRKQARSSEEGVLRPEFDLPFKPGKTIDKEPLLSHLKKQVRRAPKDKRSKRTSQSIYVCLFEDCDMFGIKVGADPRAGLNISRRSLF